MQAESIPSWNARAAARSLVTIASEWPEPYSLTWSIASLDGVHDPHRQDQREELLAPVGVARRRDGRIDRPHALVAAQLDALGAQRGERAREERRGDIGVHEQRLGRVARARPLDLRVDDDPLRRGEIGRRVHVDVAVARRRVDHRHRRDRGDRLLQALSPARDDQVDDALLGGELRQRLAIAGDQADRARRQLRRRLDRDPRQHGVRVRGATTSRAAAPRCPDFRHSAAASIVTFGRAS